jgi:rod shape determining protein RodA
MALPSKAYKNRFDWLTISIYACLVIVGWLMLYAAVYEDGVSFNPFSRESPLFTQTIWIILSFVAFWLVSNLDWKIWASIAYPIYGLAIVLLIAVILFGPEIKGARSWFRIAGFSFQPSEFAKLATALALSAYLSVYNCDLRKIKSRAIAFGIIILPMALIVIQGDPGSASIFLAFGFVLYREGLNSSFFIAAISLFLAFVLTIMFEPLIVIPLFIAAVGLVFLSQLRNKRTGIIIFLSAFALHILLWNFPLESYEFFENISRKSILISLLCIDIVGISVASFYLWSKRSRQLVTILMPALILISGISVGTNYIFNNLLKPHQQDRINVWLKPSECDPRKSLYNIIQSKTAIGSGGLVGKGYLNGTMTELDHVPEQTTDFIFSIVGEEQGFLGVLSIILLFGVLIYRIIMIGEKAKNLYVRRYSYAIAGMLFFHVFINIGMTMGICPVIGIPLPFLSKGGTALLFFSIMIGILVKMEHSRFET